MDALRGRESTSFNKLQKVKTVDKVTIKITGESPILLHADTLANPLNAAAKEYSKLTGKQKKTDEDRLLIARKEWEAGFYRDKKGNLVLPSNMLFSALVNGAKMTKKGMAIKRGAMFMESSFILQHDAPKDMDEMWESGEYVDMRMVVVGQARVARCRPKLPNWSLEVDIYVDSKILNKEDLIGYFDAAGRYAGLGDYGPRNGGIFGRFSVKEV
jgi:hypothetical protein